jgi:hypothetical protein
MIEHSRIIHAVRPGRIFNPLTGYDNYTAYRWSVLPVLHSGSSPLCMSWDGVLSWPGLWFWFAESHLGASISVDSGVRLP